MRTGWFEVSLRRIPTRLGNAQANLTFRSLLWNLCHADGLPFSLKFIVYSLKSHADGF